MKTTYRCPKCSRTVSIRTISEPPKHPPTCSAHVGRKTVVMEREA